MLTVGANEAEKEDGEQKSAVQRDSEYVGQLLTEAAAVEKQKREPVIQVCRLLRRQNL